MNKKKLQWNVAAVAALAKGDLENAMIAATPGGIEAQEKQGQIELVGSTMLPKDGPWDKLEQLGFTRLDDIDDLFVRAQFPEGWTRAATEHSRHGVILDEKGRERIRVFYKAAFYDRRADFGLARRFCASCAPVCGWDSPEYDHATTPLWGAVDDCGVVIWHTEETISRPESGANQEEWSAFYDEQDALAEQAQAWLGKHYPDWRNPLAYWEETE